MKKYLGFLIVLSVLIFGISSVQAEDLTTSDITTSVTSVVSQQIENTKVAVDTSNVTISAPVIFKRALNVGSKGEDVKALQDILKQKGFLAKKVVATGYYGTQTKEAVKKYQKDANFINVTGKMDTNTLKVINGTQTNIADIPVALNLVADTLTIDSSNKLEKIIIPEPIVDPSPMPLPAIYRPSVSVISPNGGENFTKGTSASSGDLLSHKVQFSSKKVGNITNYVTQSNNINDWKNMKYYWMGGGQGYNPSAGTGDTDGGASQINDAFIDAGSYYFLSIWQSQDNSEFAYDFSDNTFTISQSGRVIIPDPIITPAPTLLPPIIDPAISPSGDATSRVMFWWGKVNQHIDTNGNWQTDTDGVSGANLDRLTYCKKYFPNTTSVTDYKVEGIGTWQDRGNVQNPNNPSSYYYTLKMSTKCVQDSSVSPASLTVVYPNGGEAFTAGQQITVKWSTNIISANDLVDILIQHYYPAGNGIDDANSGVNLTVSGTLNDGLETVTLPTQYSGRPFGQYFKILVIKHPYNISNTVYDVSDNLFTINSSTTSCLGPVVSKNTSYANQTTNPNILNYKIGSFNIQNNCFNESVRVTNLKVGINQNSSAVPISDLANLVIKDSMNNVLTTPIQPSYNNNFPVDFVILAGQTYVVNIYSDIGSIISGIAQTNLGYNAFGITTNTSYPAVVSLNPVSGQIITIGTGISVNSNSY